MGVIVASTLDLMRERSAELTAQLVVWAATDTAGRGVTPQQLVGAVARWTSTVVHHLVTLDRSFNNLKERPGVRGDSS